MINKDGGGGQFQDFMGGHSCYEGRHRAHGGIPPVPPTRENPAPGRIGLSQIFMYINTHHEIKHTFPKLFESKTHMTMIIKPIQQLYAQTGKRNTLHNKLRPTDNFYEADQLKNSS